VRRLLQATSCGLVLALAALAGCGGDSNPTTSTGGPPPAKLFGTYTSTLKPGDLPQPVPAALKPPLAWRLKIERSPVGEAGHGPHMLIFSPQHYVQEEPRLSVSGDTLNLSHEPCPKPNGGSRVVTRYVTSAYRWQLRGKTLRLTVTKPGCFDKVARTILASEPWKRS
jgi:hypothetical protein